MKQSRSIFLNIKEDKVARCWDLTVSSEGVDPNQLDAKTIADALIIAAVENLIKKNEQALAALRGKRGKRYTLERQILKAAIEDLKAWQSLQPSLPASVESWRERY